MRRFGFALSIAGTNTFEVGNTVIPYLISPDGSLGLRGIGSDNPSDGIRIQGFKNLLNLPHNKLFEAAYADTMGAGLALVAKKRTSATTVEAMNIVGEELTVWAKVTGKREAAEVYHELLEHRWYLSEQASGEVPRGEAVTSYVEQLRKQPDERRAIVEP